LQETVEQQAATIQQLTDIVAKNEARHHSLERMIRWMGVGVFVLAIMFVIPMKQELFSVAHANEVDEQQPRTLMPTCGQLPQMPCDQVQSMLMTMFGQMMAEAGKELAPVAKQAYQAILGHSENYLAFMSVNIKDKINDLENKLAHAPAGSDKQKYLQSKINELKSILDFGANMTLMDHIANIDYDFNNLADVGYAIPKMMADIDNMSKRMDIMAFDIHNMAAAGVPVMGRMNNATSWMPGW
ncbi:hypothetical protein, partial [Candidatus Albibeggiatoa sp. nov. BB20]|uniref:hypothetical protein n=1 Tax=Candidatus Albibeggiatoa sp. nov. BB20 TaxID=3162723 RepID=UPI0033655617